MNFENSESNILKKNLEKNIFSIKNKIKNALLAASMVSMINGCHFIPKNNSDNWNEFCNENNSSLICKNKIDLVGVKPSVIDFEIKKENGDVDYFEVNSSLKRGEFFKSKPESEKRKKIKEIYDIFFTSYKYKIDDADKWDFVDSDNRGDCEDFALSFSEKILEEKTFTKDDVEVHFGYLNDKNNNKKFYHAWVILKDGDDDIFYDSGFSNLETVKKDNKYYIINDENVYFESEEKLW